MKLPGARFVVGLSLAWAVAGCGGNSGAPQYDPKTLCQRICANEAKLACPNGNQEACVTECQSVLVEDKRLYPGCVDQINKVFACTGTVATTSIHCSATSSAPRYDPLFCPTEVAALNTCLPTTGCNIIANTAPTIERTAVAAELPIADAAGGPLLAATYFRTAATEYTGAGGPTGPTGRTDKQTIAISASTGTAFVLQSVQSTNGAADQRGTLRVTPSGTVVSLLATCPYNAPFADFPYTATETAITLYNTIENVVEVYTKQ